jgi:ABC-type nitrate/sulfonate/bicarbonate transport system permease component
VGLAAGVAAGLGIGALAALLVRQAPVVDGLLDFARSVPPVVILPICLLAFGYNELARVATVAAGCVWTISLAVITAAASPRSARREMLEVAGATPLRALGWTQPWESLGVLVVGLRASASTAVVVAVVTEMIAGTEHGLGARVIAAQIAGDTPGLTLDVLAAGILGYLVNLGLRGLERWVRRLET